MVFCFCLYPSNPAWYCELTWDSSVDSNSTKTEIYTVPLINAKSLVWKLTSLVDVNQKADKVRYTETNVTVSFTLCHLFDWRSPNLPDNSQILINLTNSLSSYFFIIAKCKQAYHWCRKTVTSINSLHDLKVIPFPVRSLSIWHRLPKKYSITPNIAGRTELPVSDSFWRRPPNRNFTTLQNQRFLRHFASWGHELPVVLYVLSNSWS